MKISIEELRKYNQGYDTDPSKGIKEDDLKIANDVILKLEHLNRSVPRIGDIVIIVCGEKRVRCHIETFDTSRGGNLCQNCHFSYISFLTDDQYYCSSSGGPWITCSCIEKFKYIGITTRQFWTWGRFGVGANNSIRFPATVSMWEIYMNDVYM